MRDIPYLSQSLRPCCNGESMEFCNTALLIQLALQFFNIGFGTCIILGSTFGMGKKLVYFEELMASFCTAMLCFCLGQLFYVVTSVLVRLLITITLVRLAVDNLHWGILFAATVLSIVAGTIFFFAISRCTPVAYYWNRNYGRGPLLEH
ncbi:hypothetical protein DPV78_006091 [Talaromyces pinophilus]|nr:hypothetical protein DPV78_006091 [Talaromyces pinophilus]